MKIFNIYTINAVIWVIIGYSLMFNKLKLAKILYLASLMWFIVMFLSLIPVFCWKEKVMFNICLIINIISLAIWIYLQYKNSKSKVSGVVYMVGICVSL